ncbi:MAG: urate hydroxylase PuuD [Actinomycetota bacterium]|nr:urate hydroxylase PuuD [Actinomycetota bacterium]
MDPYLSDWLNLAVRWLHVIAGIAWIGASLYFIHLDLSLRPPERREDAERGIGGEYWSVHGGGFYHVQKYRVAPERLPEPLHWFKWEAYTTWLSGFALLVVLYYANADTYLVDPNVAALSEWEAVGASVGLLAAAWVVYDVLCRLLAQRDRLLAVAVAALAVVAAYGASQLFSGRGAYIQVGAMLGTIMAANVFLNIIPAHRELVAAKKAGREPDPAPGLEAKQRSVHNNYLTLPVVFTMVSNHFPFMYGHARSWLVLVAMMGIGAWLRHFFNLRHRGKTVLAIPATAAVAAAALAVAIRPAGEGAGPSAGARRVDFSRVEAIVAERCAPCHSATPTRASAAPKGIVLDTPSQIAARASEIEQQAVATKAMPPGNVTGITDEERDLLAAWIDQGAKVR